MRSRPLKKIVDHVQVDSNAWTLDEQLCLTPCRSA
jgi:hypothetical protein